MWSQCVPGVFKLSFSGIGRAHKLWSSKKFYSKAKSKYRWDTLHNSWRLPELACSRVVTRCLLSPCMGFRRRTWLLRMGCRNFSVSGDRLGIHKPFFFMFALSHDASDFISCPCWVMHGHHTINRGFPLKVHSEVTVYLIAHTPKTSLVWVGLLPPLWMYATVSVVTKGKLLRVARWPQVEVTRLFWLERGVHTDWCRWGPG